MRSCRAPDFPLHSGEQIYQNSSIQHSAISLQPNRPGDSALTGPVRERPGELDANLSHITVYNLLTI